MLPIYSSVSLAALDVDVILTRRTSSLSLCTNLTRIPPCTICERSRLTLLELLGPHDISDLNICLGVKLLREIETIAVPGDLLVLTVVGTAAVPSGRTRDTL